MRLIQLLEQPIDFTIHEKTVLGLMGVQPKRVNGDWSCERVGVTSLEGCPEVVTGRFSCSGNPLISLKHSPTKVTIFSCGQNSELTSLEGVPSIIERSLILTGCLKLKSLKGIHHQIKEVGQHIFLAGCPIESHMLGLMKIKGLCGIDFHLFHKKDDPYKKLELIFNKHLEGNVNGCNLGACQDELEEAGFEKYAQL